MTTTLQRHGTRRPRRWAVSLACALMFTVQSPAAAKDPDRVEAMKIRALDVERMITEAEEGARRDEPVTVKALAKRLVEGQLLLAERDTEQAAIVFLDIIENHPGTPAASQAIFFLGKALVYLEMDGWAVECFGRNLVDNAPDGRRYHQESVAELLRLRTPARQPGFARTPGLSATPERRARIRSLGGRVELGLLPSVLSEIDGERVLAWARSVPPANRAPKLRYEFGRALYLLGDFSAAYEELASLLEPAEDDSRGQALALRAGYIAGASALGRKEEAIALELFQFVTQIPARTDDDDEVVALAWMAQGRIHHDAGRFEEAIGAYRKISRDSELFQEALYETAWILLRDASFDRAVQALDLLLIYDPESSIAWEIKQLRGKIKIRSRDYRGAEEEFIALRKEFDGLARRLTGKLTSRSDSESYFAAVVAQDMEHFRLDAVLPMEAVPVAKRIPRAVQAEAVVRELGSLDAMLTETEALLVRMEQAVRAPERARLFQDLGGYLASLDAVALDVVTIKEQLITEVRVKRNNPRAQTLESQRRQARRALDQSLEGTRRGEMLKKIETLAEQAHKYDLTVAALRAQLVGTERYYEQTRNRQRIDRSAYLTQVSELRDEIGRLQRESGRIENALEALRTRMRFEDPWAASERRAIQSYSQYLDAMMRELTMKGAGKAAKGVFATVRQYEGRIEEARVALDAAAGQRLTRAIEIIDEERVNLDRYRLQLNATGEQTRVLAGGVLQAAVNDVIAEVVNLVTRSEVGLLDVAWAIQESELEEIRRLDGNRARDLREIERTLEQGLVELE